MSSLDFYSTNAQSPSVNLKQALMRGQAPDRGLYMPSVIPKLTPETLAAFRGMTYAEVATEVLSAYSGGVLTRDEIAGLCHDAYDFPVPVELVHDRQYVMYLDRGPTAAFKDFAARMMSRMLGRFVREDNAELLILTATSGDTGAAVAGAFHGVPGTRVVVLFPTTEVSNRQRRQMTTLGGNVTAVAINGKFDDCQAMVKQAFADPELADLNLSSANSINIGRLLPQSVFYFWAAAQVAEAGEPIVIVVPSGNFGNMMGCVLAMHMGLPVQRLVVPVNENDEFPEFLHTGDYHKIEPSRACLSNAMNVGHPSNLARLVAIYGGHMDEKGLVHRAPDMDAMRRDLFSTSISDVRTRETIANAWRDHKLLLEPHGAVGWAGLQDYIVEVGLKGAPAVVLETAHPAKFPDEIERAIGITPEVPESLSKLDNLEEAYARMDVDYEMFKHYLLDNHQSVNA